MTAPTPTSAPTPIPTIDEGASCSADRSCPPESGCCSSPTSDSSTPAKATSRRGLRAAALAVACAVACLAVPLAVGGAAAVGGALAGEWWIVVAILAVTGVVGSVMMQRRRATGRVC